MRSCTTTMQYRYDVHSTANCSTVHGSCSTIRFEGVLQQLINREPVVRLGSRSRPNSGIHRVFNLAKSLPSLLNSWKIRHSWEILGKSAMLNYAQRIRHLWGVFRSVHAACSRESKFDALKCIVLLTGFCFDSGSRNIVYMYPWWLELVGGAFTRCTGPSTRCPACRTRRPRSWR